MRLNKRSLLTGTRWGLIFLTDLSTILSPLQSSNYFTATMKAIIVTFPSIFLQFVSKILQIFLIFPLCLYLCQVSSKQPLRWIMTNYPKSKDWVTNTDSLCQNILSTRDIQLTRMCREKHEIYIIKYHFFWIKSKLLSNVCKFQSNSKFSTFSFFSSKTWRKSSMFLFFWMLVYSYFFSMYTIHTNPGYITQSTCGCHYVLYH